METLHALSWVKDVLTSPSTISKIFAAVKTISDVVVGFNERFDKMDRRFNSVDKRLDTIELRLDLAGVKPLKPPPPAEGVGK